MEHKNVRISDAIPQRPASFDNAVEQTLARVCQKEQQKEQQKETPVRAWKTETGTERKRRSWRSVLGGVAVASLVVLCVGAIGGVLIKNTLFKSDNRPNPISGTVSQQPTEGTPAIRYHGMLYRISESGQEYAGEVDESVIQRTTEEPVSASEWPTKEGQTNFGEISVPYAMTANGLVVQIDHEWKLFEPVLPDEADSLFPTASAMIGKSYYLVNNEPVYPYESLLWESGPDYNVDGESVEHKLADEDVQKAIPEAAYGAGLNFEILVKDGWTLDEIAIFSDAYERIATAGRNELRLTEQGCANPECVTTLQPGIYYVSALVENRDEQISKGSEIVIRLLVKEDAEAPEPIGDRPQQQSSAIPSTFRFWEYDEESGYREAPANGVLFVCDFDGDGTEEEITYRLSDSHLEITVGDRSKDMNIGAGVEQVILIDLDPDVAGMNLLVVANYGSEDYETAELHMQNGKLKAGPVICAYCEWNGTALYGGSTQTDILGTRQGGRIYRGSDLKPDSEWFDCERIPTESERTNDREMLLENGILLHVRRDLPCTIDGQDAVIEPGTYLYVTRWHESATRVEVQTEDGRTAQIAVKWQDEVGFTIAGLHQNEYFDSVFYAD